MVVVRLTTLVVAVFSLFISSVHLIEPPYPRLFLPIYYFFNFKVPSFYDDPSDRGLEQAFAVLLQLENERDVRRPLR